MRVWLKGLLTIAASLVGAVAYAAAPAPTHSPEQGLLSMLPMLVIFGAVFYFLLIRPQTKRAKEQKEMLSALQLGDEVLTSAGIVGRVTKLRDNYTGILIARDTEIMVQKNAIANVLPKGSLDLPG